VGIIIVFTGIYRCLDCLLCAVVAATTMLYRIVFLSFILSVSIDKTPDRFSRFERRKCNERFRLK